MPDAVPPFEKRVALHRSPTCVEHVETKRRVPPPPAAQGEDELTLTLEKLRAREAGLQAHLAAANYAVEEAEAAAHGVVRCDPPTNAVDRTTEDVLTSLRARAHLRVGEWAAALGGGRVTLSQAFPVPPGSLPTPGACACRREAYAVQLYTRERRLQVAALRLSGLPPEGRREQWVDVTWLDAKGGSDGVHHGLPRLAALAGSVQVRAEDYDLDALQQSLRCLETPPLDYVHLRTQPLLQGGRGECLQLSRVLAAIGAELCAWARLDEPLPPNDGAADALHFALLEPPAAAPPATDQAATTPAGGDTIDRLTAPAVRADLAVRWWARLHLYVGSAMLGQASLGHQRWLDSANAILRAYRGGFIDQSSSNGAATGGPAELVDLHPDAPNAIVFALRIQRHPQADAERQRRAQQLLDTLIDAAPPLVSQAVAELAARYQ